MDRSEPGDPVDPEPRPGPDEPDQAPEPATPTAADSSISCDATITATTFSYPPDAAGLPGFSHHVVDGYVSGLHSTDLIDLPQAQDRPVTARISRAGSVVAEVDLAPSPAGEGWLIVQFSACDSAGLELRELPADPSATAAGEVLVVCDGTDAQVASDTAVVKARRDGVHIRVENTSGVELAVSLDWRGGGRGDGAQPGTSTIVAPLGTGPVWVVCFDGLSAVDPSEIPRTAYFDVVDPDGHWKSTLLDCDAGFSVSAAPPVEGTPGDMRDAVVIAEEDFRRYKLGPDTVIERAGYQEEGVQHVRAVKDGRAVLVATYFEAPDGGLWLSDVQGCSDIE